MRIAVALLILALPIAEIVGLVKVGQLIGVWPTIGLVLAAGVTGFAVLNVQGLKTVRGLGAAMERGDTPMLPMLEGLLLAIAGLLLIVPGFISDVVGIVLLVPPVRRLAAGGLLRWFAAHGEVHVETFDGTAYRRTGSAPGDGARAGGPVIEGEFTRIDERPLEQRPGRRGGEEPPPR